MYHQVAVARDSVTLSFLIFFFLSDSLSRVTVKRTKDCQTLRGLFSSLDSEKVSARKDLLEQLAPLWLYSYIEPKLRIGTGNLGFVML